ncbi:MAG: peptide-N-glycosidase F-related protein, partial [Candidatus Kapabacteria bacterium]|nr:peptide-N-glycosidase F-related protein [Candidatus Kapabacteria bacterium]
MKRISTLFKNFVLFACLFGFVASELPAQEVVKVQTLTFDDITKRRDVYQFPDNDDTYSKIMMYYTLKCDPRTTRDKFNCGEWDYLTYTFLYLPTDIMDTTVHEHPRYMLGNTSPDTIRVISTPTYTNNIQRRFSIVYDSTISEEKYTWGLGDSELSLAPGSNHFQFLIPRDDLRDLGAAKDDIKKLILNVKSTDGTLKNFTVKLATTFGKDTDEFDYDDLVTVFQNDITLTTGENVLGLINDVRWNGIGSMLVDISFNSSEATAPTILVGTDTNNVISVSGNDKYLSFDGAGDFAEVDNIEALNGATAFTFEGWMKVNKWTNWSNFMGIEEKSIIQLGNGVGQIYCIIRNPGDNNKHGNVANAIKLGEWAHIAMVYDGSAANNSGKLKLFVNGFEKTLAFNGDVPSSSIAEALPFRLNSGGKNKAEFDEVRVWTKALDGETIMNWYNSSLDDSHPDYASLEAYYPMEENEELILVDKSGKDNDGVMVGIPATTAYSDDEIFINSMLSETAPNLIIVQGEYESHLDSVDTIIETKNNMISVKEYSIIDSAFVMLPEIINAWPAGWQYTYDPYGVVVDSVYITPDTEYINETLIFKEPYPRVNRIEIARYITPYGINLDLGPEGFTWVYDVTDYAQYLKGDVDLAAGNNQELIDLRFEMTKGTPPRDVVNVQQLWAPMSTYQYGKMDDDEVLKEIDIILAPEAEQFKLKTRFTGHGEFRSTGQPVSCCEWKDNTHTVIVNGNNEINWKIWQTEDCGLNPVQPQGGTWPHAREGWCPGDVVKENEFELTEYIKDHELSLDYDISDVPQNNQATRSGNYRVAMHLIEYGPMNFENDVEIIDVLSPNDWPYHSIRNPLCAPPKVVIRNNKAETLTGLKFKYSVSGSSDKEEYLWTGNLKTMQYDTVALPISGVEFWRGDLDYIFSVSLSDPNEAEDDNPVNNSLKSHFIKPDLFEDDIVINIHTNTFENDVHYQITDIEGDIVNQSGKMDVETLYKDALVLPDGCYTLEVFSNSGNGLNYWYAKQVYGQGDLGKISFRRPDGSLLKAFDPDFGARLRYSFTIGDVLDVADPNYQALLSIFPNPVENNINVDVDYNMGETELGSYDLKGNKFF